MLLAVYRVMDLKPQKEPKCHSSSMLFWEGRQDFGAGGPGSRSQLSANDWAFFQVSDFDSVLKIGPVSISEWFHLLK